MVSVAALGLPSPIAIGQQGQEAEGLFVLGEPDKTGICPSSLPTMNPWWARLAWIEVHTHPAGSPQEFPRSMPSDGMETDVLEGVAWDGWCQEAGRAGGRGLKHSTDGRHCPRVPAECPGWDF